MSKLKQNASTVLGLALDGSRLEGALLRRTNGSATLQKSFAASLTLDPLLLNSLQNFRFLRFCCVMIARGPIFY